MADDNVRIGIIGAGAVVRLRHLPGFQAIGEASVVGVCNRSRESSEKVAAEYEIPNVYDDWMDLVKEPNLDAVCVGTWPYMHKALTLAALENGKHVLCQARMAMDAQEARDMLDASRKYPNLVTQVVPTSIVVRVDPIMRKLIASGYLGDLLAIDLRVFQNNFVDSDAPLHWRFDEDVSGFNILNMGSWYEALLRWVGPARKVTAMASVNVKQRRDDGGVLRAISIPDHVDILSEMACGAQARMSFSSVAGLAPPAELCLYGSDGTLRLSGSPLVLQGGRRGESQLSDIPIPPEEEGTWRVEQEFIDAVHGKEKVTHNTFEEGVRYMEFSEAVVRSYKTGQAIPLPLL